MCTVGKCLIVFLLFCIGTHAQTQPRWISNEGSDNQWCNETFPCATVTQALHSYDLSSVTRIDIIMYPGSYQGDQNINVNLPNVPAFFSSTNNSAIAIFDCQNNFTSIFNITSSLTLTGVTLSNCDMGIEMNSTMTQSITLNSCRLENLDVAVRQSNGAFYATNTEFLDNKISIEAKNNFISLTSSNFEDNTHHSIVSIDSLGVELTNTNFTRSSMITIEQASEHSVQVMNCTWNYGRSRAIVLQGGSMNVANSNFMNSEEEYENGGAIAIEQVQVVSLDNVNFYNTSSHGNGGAVYVNQSSIYIDDCSFTSCIAASNGGAVFVDNCNIDVSFKNSTFESNSATGYGGGIGLNTIDSSCVFTATFDGVSLFEYNQALYGAAIGCCGSDTSTCGTSVSYDSTDNIDLSQNNNIQPDGDDVSCLIVTYSGGDGDGTDDNGSNSTNPWVWVGVAFGIIFLVVAAVALGGLAFFIKGKKQSSYDEI